MEVLFKMLDQVQSQDYEAREAGTLATHSQLSVGSLNPCCFSCVTLAPTLMELTT